MSFLGFTVSSGLRAYDTFPSAILTAVEDWGWSLLPQFPGSVREPQGASIPRPLPDREPERPAEIFEVPVGVETGSTGQAARVYSVLPRSEPARAVPVPRETVVVGDVATEVERHPEGDFPAGSIFAPGQAWEPEYDSYGGEPDVAIDWGGVGEWALETLTGQQPWQTFGQQAVGPPAKASFVETLVPTSSPRPSGRAALPPSAAPYTGGTMTGDNCGNRRYVTLDRETGKISCRRRRRPRLLTNRDLADLASLKTIVGGGAALNAAVIRAVR